MNTQHYFMIYFFSPFTSVSLRTFNTLIKVPKYHHTKADRNTQQNDTDDEIESHTIQWQDKRLSRKEILFFADKENCQTDAQKEYHQTIKRYGLDNDERSFDKIFTYVSEDSFNADGDDKELSKFIQRVEELDEESLNGELITSKSGKEKLFTGIFGFETMYIMADLAVETILFTIRWRSRDGLLIVYPDFNVMATNPYLQEIDSDTKQMFHYAMENLSEDNDHVESRMKKDIEVISQLKSLSITTPAAFHVPPKRCTNVFLFIEIESAEGFEYDNIHVRYNVVLPNRCELLDGITDGSTHSSRKGPVNESTNIGYCHEMMMLCHTDYQWEGKINFIF